VFYKCFCLNAHTIIIITFRMKKFLLAHIVIVHYIAARSWGTTATWHCLVQPDFSVPTHGKTLMQHKIGLHAQFKHLQDDLVNPGPSQKQHCVLLRWSRSCKNFPISVCISYILHNLLNWRPFTIHKNLEGQQVFFFVSHHMIGSFLELSGMTGWQGCSFFCSSHHLGIACQFLIKLAQIV
jgi:hypothetical protein